MHAISEKGRQSLNEEKSDNREFDETCSLFATEFYKYA